MWTYNYNNYELYHHGVKGMRWGVRRYQNPDGTLTKAGKRRLAKEEYNKDLDKAIAKAEQSGDTRSYWMSVTRNSGANYANYIVRGAAGGLLASGINSLATHATGKKLARNLIMGAVGGMTIGTVQAASRVGRGRLIAENDYGVKSMHER